MNELIKSLEQEQLKNEVPNFGPGDTVRVHVKIVEGKRERVQVFEGVVMKRQGGGARETFTVRKISFNVGVERTFPVHSPKIEKIEVTRKGKVRRAKINYLRTRTGKAAKIKEDPEILCNLGMAYLNTGNIDDAIYYIERAYELNPEDEITIACMRELDNYRVN